MKRKRVRVNKKWIIGSILVIFILIPILVKAGNIMKLRATESETEDVLLSNDDSQSTTSQSTTSHSTQKLETNQEADEVEGDDVLDSDGRVIENRYSKTTYSNKKTRGAEDIYFSTFKIDKFTDGTPDWDPVIKDIENGYDSAPDNNKIRSFDSNNYNFQISLDSGDGKSYTDVVLKLTGKVTKNGVSPDKKYLWASFSEGSTINLDKGTSEMNVILNSSGQGGPINTGDGLTKGAVLNVFGASNGTLISTEYKIQVMSATDTVTKEVFDLSSKNITASTKQSIDTTVTSRVSIGIIKPLNDVPGFDGVSSFNDATNSTDYPETELLNLGIGLEMVALPGRAPTDFKGSAYPQGKVTLHAKQTVTDDSDKELTLGEDENSDQLPMKIFAFGDLMRKGSEGYKTYDVLFDKKYPGYYEMNPYQVMLPGSQRKPISLADYTVKDSGKISVKNNIDNSFTIEFEDYSIDNIFPTRVISASVTTNYFTNKRLFATAGLYMFTPYTYISGKTANLRNKIIFDELTYFDETGKEFTIKQDVTLSYTKDQKTPGSLLTTVKALSIEGQSIGSDSTVITPSGDSVIGIGQQYFYRSRIATNSKSFKKLQNFSVWNPKSIIFNNVSSQNGGVGADGNTNPYVMSYGVKKDENYTQAELARGDLNPETDYIWEKTAEAAKKHGDISAMRQLITPKTTSAIGTITGFYIRVTASSQTGILDQEGNPNIMITRGYVDFDGDGKYEALDPKPTTPGTNTNSQLGLDRVEAPKYDLEGKMTERIKPISRFVDAVYHAPFTSSLGKSVSPSSSGSTTFQSSEIVHWTLTPAIKSVSQSIGEQPTTEVTIVDSLPKGVRYREGTAKYTPRAGVNNIPLNLNTEVIFDKGVETLTFTLPDVKIGILLGTITFDTYFDQSNLDFSGGSTANLENKALISAVGDNSTEKMRQATQKFNVSKMSSWGISKSVDKTVTETDGKSSEITYTLTVYNDRDDNVEFPKVLDVLPFIGDTGTTFSGNYELIDASVYGSNGTTPDKKSKIYYNDNFRHSEARNTDPNDIEPEIGETLPSWFDWMEYDKGSNPIVEADALYFNLSKISPGEKKVIKISLRLSDGEPGELLLNAASGNSESDAKINSNYTYTSLVNRKITGTVWTDANYNGGIDTSEERLKDIKVALYSIGDKNKLTRITENIKGEKFVDDSGTSLIRTNQKGQYVFESLIAGDYVVGFEVKDEVNNEELFITKFKELGIANNFNSKVSLSETYEKSYITPISEKYNLPTIDKVTRPVESVDYINLGVLKKPSLKIKKGVYNESDPISRKNIHEGKVKVGDTIHYELVLTNPNVGSIVEDIKVFDNIPEGLKYKLGTLTLLKSDGSSVKLPDEAFDEETGRVLKTDSLGDLVGPNEKIIIGFDVEITKKASGTLTNIASATGKVIDNKPEEEKKVESNEVWNQIFPAPSIVKNAMDSNNKEIKKARIGDVIPYTLTVTNKKGAGNWSNVTVTDKLESYLQYEVNSTKLNGESVSDTASWDKQKLSLEIGDISEDETVVISFQVKVVEIPLNGVIYNIAEANGKDGDGASTPEVTDDYKIETDYILLHLRQVVLDSHPEVVVPSQGYFELFNKEKQEEPLSLMNYQLVTKSTEIDNSEKINQTLFTSRLVGLEKEESGIVIEDVVPEYYRYVGHIQTTNGSSLAADHLSVNLPNNANNYVPYLDYRLAKEYWVTVYIEPKMGKNLQGEPEKSPRPYSWDSKVNEFGQLKQ